MCDRWNGKVEINENKTSWFSALIIFWETCYDINDICSVKIRNYCTSFINCVVLCKLRENKKSLSL